ncbi:PIN domain-containing protein [bacterium]|nr:PIN domain-containing protein [bacterium]MBU2461969.1 PIN domain-containing protein [bacterium]
MKLLIDTWGWVSLYNKREKRHKEVKDCYHDFRSQGEILYTTDYILDETFTLLFRRTPFELAAEAMEKIDESIKNDYLFLERINLDRFEEAKRLRLKYRDKPLISFTDITSIVVMSEEKIEAILTEDVHFTYVELGFQRLPQ